MNIIDFLHFNDRCPICNNPLHLYMQWYKFDFFNANKLFMSYKENSTFYFSEIIDPNNTDESKFIITLSETSNNYKLTFNHPMIKKIAKNQDEIYLYFLCNPQGIKNIGHDYEINIQQACYYRSTPLLNIKYNKFKLINQSHSFVNRDEVFSITHTSQDLNKIYVLSRNFEENKSTLWHYLASNEQLKDESFQLEIFEKDMPLLPPMTWNQSTLIDKFNTWITYS